MEAEGLILVEALGLILGETEADTEAEGERLGEAEDETEAEGDREAEGDNEGEALALAEDEGLSEALGLREGLGAGVRPGASPNQSTPGRGPGWPSSYKKQLSASSSASLGNRERSIRVITPLRQFVRVRYWGFGKVVGESSLIVSGMARSPS